MDPGKKNSISEAAINYGFLNTVNKLYLGFALCSFTLLDLPAQDAQDPWGTCGPNTFNKIY